MTDKTQTTTTESKTRKRALDAGCEILFEKVAEAHEPEWREILSRIYDAMDAEYGP